MRAVVLGNVLELGLGKIIHQDDIELLLGLVERSPERMRRAAIALDL